MFLVSVDDIQNLATFFPYDVGLDFFSLQQGFPVILRNGISGIRPRDAVILGHI